MAGRSTNVALLLLLPVAAISGFVAFGIGTSPGVIAVVVHGLAGFAVVVLAPWKRAIVRRGMRRRRRGRAWSVLLTAFAAITVGSGFIQSTGVARSIGPFTTMQVHVGSAVAAVLLGVVHVRARPVRVRSVDWSRRAFLRSGGLAVASGVAFLGSEGLMRILGLRGADRRFTGSHERGSFDPDAMPATQWFDDSTEHVDPSTYRLIVQDRPYSLEELGEPSDALVATLDCTTGWYSKQEWAGVALARLVSALDGNSVLIRSATGYSRRFPISDIEHLLLATHVGGRPLSAGHGSPVRLVAPGRRGFWWVKWVEEVRVDNRPAWWQSPFPLT